jgi:hypothetical protein
MSTRSVIARPDGKDGFAGHYAHWDGYPTCRGAQLWATYREFNNIHALRGYAIREGFKGYWSSYMTAADAAIEERVPAKVLCTYCDGTGERIWDGVAKKCNACQGTLIMNNSAKRNGWVEEDTDNWVTSNGDDCGTEWAYVLGDESLVIFERRFGRPDTDQGHGTGMFGLGASDTEAGGYWQKVAAIPWTADEPDWEAIEKTNYEEGE